MSLFFVWNVSLMAAYSRGCAVWVSPAIRGAVRSAVVEFGLPRRLQCKQMLFVDWRVKLEERSCARVKITNEKCELQYCNNK